MNYYTPVILRHNALVNAHGSHVQVQMRVFVSAYVCLGGGGGALEHRQIFVDVQHLPHPSL